MNYSVVINLESRFSTDYQFKRFGSWQEIRDLLRNSLPPLTTSVEITKLSSNHKVLGCITVRMNNLIEVANSEDDKILRKG